MARLGFEHRVATVAFVEPLAGIGGHPLSLDVTAHRAGKMVVGKLLQPFKFGVDGGSAGEVGVEGGLLGVHRGLRDVIDDTTMNALFNQEAK